MNNPVINTAFTQLYRLLEPVSSPWLIIGTASLYLQQYPVVPNDIDILCANEVAVEIEQLLAPFRLPDPEKLSRSKFRSRFSRYYIAGFEVELMGGLEVNTLHGWVDLLGEIENSEQVELNECVFSVPSKKDQLKIYALFGRPKDSTTLDMLSV